jgi:hypothetical protein
VAKSFGRRAPQHTIKPAPQAVGVVLRIRHWIDVLDEWELPLPGFRTALAVKTAATEAGVTTAAMRARASYVLSRWSELGCARRHARALRGRIPRQER